MRSEIPRQPDQLRAEIPKWNRGQERVRPVRRPVVDEDDLDRNRERRRERLDRRDQLWNIFSFIEKRNNDRNFRIRHAGNLFLIQKLRI